MALIGYQRNSENKNGGIRTIGLINQTDVTGLTYVDAERAVSALTLAEGASFTRYDFREDEAEYKESITMSNHSWVVTHELRFLLDKMGRNASKSIASLLTNSPAGLLALVVTNNNEVFLVGYSARFEKERPLRVQTIAGSSGKQLRDETTEIITLQSTDTDKAPAFMGDISTLL